MNFKYPFASSRQAAGAGVGAEVPNQALPLQRVIGIALADLLRPLLGGVFAAFRVGLRALHSLGRRHHRHRAGQVVVHGDPPLLNPL